MVKLLFLPEKETQEDGGISPVKAFLLSLGARVGTGNLAGVATAIAIGGPGAVFWMWVMALLGGVNAFLENTLAQLFKEPHKQAFVGGPAYYITKGMHKKWFAYIFAVAIVADFGLANNMVQANTITAAFTGAFGLPTWVMAAALTLVSIGVLFGGVKRIANVSSVIVPFMAIAYILLTVVILGINWRTIPHCFALIFQSAFDWKAGLGGAFGTAIIVGFKRGLFSNEAGLGSSPNAAATATTKHPVNQGLIQAMGIYTDTIIICTCTALLILCSGLFDTGLNGIELTQSALSQFVGESGTFLVAFFIFFFAFSTIIANAYYGETNVRWMAQQMHARRPRVVILTYRASVTLLVLLGGLTSIDIAWGLVDVAQSVMAICNITAICFLGKYAIRCLDDYVSQLRAGKRTPVYRKETIPEIADETVCW